MWLDYARFVSAHVKIKTLSSKYIVSSFNPSTPRRTLVAPIRSIKG